jgi:hypothetical protein
MGGQHAPTSAPMVTGNGLPQPFLDADGAAQLLELDTEFCRVEPYYLASFVELVRHNEFKC